MDELYISTYTSTWMNFKKVQSIQTYVGGKKVLEIIFFYILPFEFEFSWFSVHPVGYGWKPSVQVNCSAAATRRPSTFVFVFFRVFFGLSFRAFVATIPHSISHPFLDLKSLTIPHSCEVQRLKNYIKKKTTSLWGSFTEFNCFFPSFSIEYSLLLQVLRRSSQESSLCEISCHDDDDGK